MRKIIDRLFVGNDSDCFHHKEGWVCIHACKIKCHQRAVGYTGNLRKRHPNYLHKKEENNLYLNIIDPPIPLFPNELFEYFFEFIIPHWENGKNILIHCNQGQSRAPSLALLFLAKYLGMISNLSYDSAVQDYKKLDEYFNPGNGIAKHYKRNWDQLRPEAGIQNVRENIT